MEQHTVQIREAEPDDTDAIVEILRALDWFAHLNAEPVESTKERVSRHLNLYNADDSHTAYVAEDAAGVVVGYVGVHWLPTLFLTGPEGYVSELFVAASARGQDVGTQLLEAVKAEAAERSCSRLLVLNRRNRHSYERDFYHKRGWQERPEAANFVFELRAPAG